MATSTTKTNKPLNPRGNDQSPLAYNRAKLYSGKALDFDGVNDYVDCGTLDVTAYTGISISLNLKLANTSDILRFVSLQHTGIDDLRIVQNGATIFFTLDDGTAYDVETPTLTANEWNKLDMTFDGTTLKGYLNGVSIGSLAAAFDFSTASGLLTLFKHSAASQYAEGLMSGFKIFNTALTAAQVADLYNNPEKVVPTGVDNTALKLWLPMMEGAGTTAYDGSPSGFVEDIVTGFTNGTTYPLDSFASNDDDITTAIKTSGFGGCVSNGHYYTNGQKVKVKFTYQKNSGDDLRVLFSSLVTGAGTAKSDIQNVSASGEFEHTFTMTADGIAYLQLGTGNASHSIDAVITDVYVSPYKSTNHGTISGATYVHGVGAPVSQSAVMDWNKGGNIVVYSEKLDEWTTTSLSVTQSTATAPDGSTNAYDLNDSDSGNYGILVPVASVAMAGDYVGSLFVKKTTGALSHYPGFDIGQPGAYVIIDTTNGTTATAGTGGIYSDVAITSYNDDWWRVSAKATINSTSKPMRIWPAISQNGTSVSTAATGINTFWGAQLNNGSSVGPYIPTLSTAQTSPVLLPQGLTSGRDITGVNLFENVRKQGALNLDGNSWAEVHDNGSLDITDAITLEAWIWYLEGDTDWAAISKYQAGATAFMMYIYPARRVNLFANGSSRASSNTNVLLNNDWNHVVITYDKANIRIYINGSEDNSAAYTDALTTTAEVLEIGRYYASNTYATDGSKIAQPRIYNRALTAEEVLRNYNSGKNTYTN